MSIATLESQIDDLRKQANNIQSRWAHTSDQLDRDATLSDAGRQAKRDAEHDRIRAKLSDLRRQETELIAAKKQSIEKRLFGLSTVASSDPGQVLLYRDSQDRAARLTESNEAANAFAAALRADDNILAAAILARALEAGWTSIVSEYVKQHPDAREDLNDLAKIQQYSPFEAGLSYALI